MGVNYYCCHICNEKYNKVDRVPKILPRCFHTVCSTCILKAFEVKNEVACPLDKAVSVFQNKNVAGLITNMSMLEIPPEVTPTTNEVKLLPSGDTTPTKQESPGLGSPTKKLLLKDDPNMDGLLRDERKQLVEFVTKTFENIREILDSKEIDIANEIEFAYSLEQYKLSRYRDTRPAQGQQKEKNVLTKAFSLTKDFFSGGSKDDETNDPSLSEEQRLILKQTKDVNQNFKSNVVRFENALTTRMKKFHSTYLAEEYYNVPVYPPPTEMNMMNIFKITKHLRFESKFGCLVITARDSNCHNSIEVIPDLETWKSINQVALEFGEKKLTIEMCEMIAYLWVYLGKVTQITINLGNETMTDNELVFFANYDFWASPDVHIFELDLQSSQASEDSILRVLDRLVTKMPNMESFKVTLAGTKITDIGLAKFAKGLKPLMAIREIFQLSLADTYVTDFGIAELLVPMPNVDNFLLNLSNTKIGDETVEGLAKKVLPTMPTVERFEVYLMGTAITDKSVTQLFTKLPKVKKYALGLSNTLVTDKSLEAFVKNTLPTLRALESFEIYLSKTKVTDAGVIPTFVDFSNLRNYTLGLSSTAITDRTVEAFARSTLRSFRVLETFELYLLDTPISDASISQVFIPMITVRKYALGLSSTDITDRSMDEFVNKTLTSLSKIEDLELYLSDTVVTDLTLEPLIGKIDRVERLIIDLTWSDITDKSAVAFALKVPHIQFLKDFEFKTDQTAVTRKTKKVIEDLREALLKD